MYEIFLCFNVFILCFILGGGGGSGRPPSGHADGVVGGYTGGYGNSGTGTAGGDPSPYGSPQAASATRHNNKPPSPTAPHQWNNSLRQVKFIPIL